MVMKGEHWFEFVSTGSREKKTLLGPDTSLFIKH